MIFCVVSYMAQSKGSKVLGIMRADSRAESTSPGAVTGHRDLWPPCKICCVSAATSPRQHQQHNKWLRIQRTAEELGGVTIIRDWLAGPAEDCLALLVKNDAHVQSSLTHRPDPMR